jgi:hypothetical protein
VEIQFVIEKEHLRLNLRDNGCGFNTARAASGNGLRSMQERVKRLGGTLELNSSKGKGTVIYLVVPLSQSRF